MFPDLYIINLDKDKQRYTKIKSECNKQGINPIRVKAVYGKDLKSNQKENVSFLCKLTCTDATIGCAMSHIKTWNIILDSGKENAIILEDDTVFTENVKEKVNKTLKDLPKDWDIVYLGCHGACDKKSEYTTLEIISSIIGKVTFANMEYKEISENIFVPETAIGLYAYMVSRKFCEKMKDFIIERHVDYQLNYQDLNAYAVYPKIFKANTEDSNIASTGFPHYTLNKMSKIKNKDGISYAWMLTEPQYKINTIHVKGLYYICFFIGLIVSFFVKKNAEFLFLFYLPEVFYSIQNGEDIQNLLECVIFNILGYIVGLKIKSRFLT